MRSVPNHDHLPLFLSDEGIRRPHCPAITMRTFSDTPVELLFEIFKISTQFDDPRAVEHPHLDWTTPRTFLSQRALLLRRGSLVCPLL